MTIAPGPFAPTITQWVAGTPTTDSHNNEIPGFTARQVQVLAQYPGNALEVDRPTGDVVTADLVILLGPATVVSAKDEWTATDGRRYRADGEPGRYVNPHTGTAVTQVNLRRIT